MAGHAPRQPDSIPHQSGVHQTSFLSPAQQEPTGQACALGSSYSSDRRQMINNLSKPDNRQEVNRVMKEGDWGGPKRRHNWDEKEPCMSRKGWGRVAPGRRTEPGGGTSNMAGACKEGSQAMVRL